MEGAEDKTKEQLRCELEELREQTTQLKISEVKLRQTEETLRETEERYRDFFENAPIGFHMFGPDKIIVDINQAELDMLGYFYDEIVGKKSWSDLLIPEHRRAFAKHWKDIIKYGEVRDLEYTLVRKDGRRVFVLLNASTRFDSEGRMLNTRGNVVDITERKRVEEALLRSHQQLHNLSAHLQSVRETERTNVAREIHDELGQSLTALKMDLFWLDNRLPKELELLHEKIKSMLRLTDTTIQRVKDISTKLRPGLLDDLGLAAAIEWQVAEFKNRTNIKCELSLEFEDTIPDKECTTAVFRTFQEILTNVARHAAATRVKVSLRKNAGRLVLKVKDNGIGIEEAQINNSRSFGLMGIRERVRYLKGETKISGIQGKGTTVTVSIPLNGKGGLDDKDMCR